MDSKENGILELKSLYKDNNSAFKIHFFKKFLSTTYHLKENFLIQIQEIFGRYADFIFDNSLLMILISLIITLLLGCGFLIKDSEADIFKLYSIPSTQSTSIKQIYESIYSVERISSIIISSNDGILKKDILEKLNNLTRKIHEVNFPKSEILLENQDISSSDPFYGKLPDIIKYEDICFKDFRKMCQQISVLDMYTSPDNYGLPINGVQHSLVINPLSMIPIYIPLVFGNASITYNNNNSGYNTFIINNATAILTSFFLNGTGPLAHASAIFESKLFKLFDSTEFGENISIDFNLERTLEDELYQATMMTKNDYYLIILGGFFLWLYASLSRLPLSPRNKFVPLTMGVLSSFLAFLGGTGFLYFMGIKHVAPAEAVPFLIIGIGADDCFVLINSYSLSYLHSNPKIRIKKMLKSAGTAITVTTITNLFAFFIGLLSPFYSIQIFCLACSMSLILTYVLCLTFFVPFMCIDARREFRMKWFYSYGDIFYFATHKISYIDTTLQTNYESNNKLKSFNSGVPLKIVNKNQMLNRREGFNAKLNIEDTSMLSDFKAKYLFQNFDIDIYEVISAQYNFHRLISQLYIIQKKGSVINDKRYFRVCNKISNLRTILFNNKGITSHKQIIPKESQVHIIDNSTNTKLETVKDGLKLAIESSNNFENTVIQENSFPPLNLDNSNNYGTKKTISTYTSNLIIYYSNKYKFLKEPQGNFGKFSRLFVKCFYSRWIMKTWIWVGCTLAFILLYIYFVLGIPDLSFGLEIYEFTPKDSYIKPFQAKFSKYFSPYGYKVDVIFPNYENWEIESTQAALFSLYNELDENENCTGLSNGMLIFLKTTKPLESSKQGFNKQLKNWIATSPTGRVFTNDFIFDSDGSLKSWKFAFFIPLIDDTLASHQVLESFKEILNKRRPNLFAIVHSKYAPLWESDSQIFGLTLSSMIYTLLSITMVSILLVPKILSSLISMIIIILIDLCLIGSMHLLRVKLNLISMVIILISIGYSVDYTVHTVHAFINSKGKNRKDRMSETLIMMMPPLTDGIISTMMPLLALFFSDKYILEIFFKMTIVILALAYIHGLILLPIFLSLFGPRIDN